MYDLMNMLPILYMNIYYDSVAVTIYKYHTVRCHVHVLGANSNSSQIDCRGENPTTPLEDPIKKNLAVRNTKTCTFMILGLLATTQAHWRLAISSFV